MKCSALSEPEIYELFHRILGKIQFIAEDFVALAHRSQAFGLCKDIDENDTPFIALSLQLNTVFWTGDKRLKEHLKTSNSFPRNVRHRAKKNANKFFPQWKGYEMPWEKQRI